MAIGIFKFTQRQRFYLGLTFTGLNILQVLFGILITGWSIYICVNVSPNFYTEKGEIKFVFTVTALFGTHIIIHYLVGIKVCEKCYKKSQKKNTKRQLTLWILVCLNTLLNVLILATIAVGTSKHMVRSLKHSIEKGMKSYLHNPEWKFNIDFWQFSMQCCGVESYDDWFDVVWLNKYQINLESDEVKQYRLSMENVLLPILPWSCCKLGFPMQCFHDPMQQKQSQHIWAEQPNLIIESINTDGCLNVLRRPIENGLTAFIIFASFMIINQIFIIIVARLFFTSCRNAVILGDPNSVAPGWILNRGIGTKKGRTLSEILMDLGMTKEELPRYQEIKEHEQETENVTDETKPESLRETNVKEEYIMKPREMSVENHEIAEVSPRSDGEPVSEGEEEILMIK